MYYIKSVKISQENPSYNKKQSGTFFYGPRCICVCVCVCDCQVVDYLLWASMCLESSIQLVGVKYLSWRSTLYSAVCQCYCDIKQQHMSEVRVIKIKSFVFY